MNKVILCNEFSQYKNWMKANVPNKEEHKNYTYCCNSDNVRQIQSVLVTEFIIISQIYWFSVEDWIMMMRRIR